MEIFDLSRQEAVSRNEMELLQKQQRDYKLLGRMRKKRGLTLWSFNRVTGEIKPAPVERNKVVEFRTQEPTEKDKITVEPNCIYRQALNKKNFIKILVREGFLCKVKRV